MVGHALRAVGEVFALAVTVPVHECIDVVQSELRTLDFHARSD